MKFLTEKRYKALVRDEIEDAMRERDRWQFYEERLQRLERQLGEMELTIYGLKQKVDGPVLACEVNANATN